MKRFALIIPTIVAIFFFVLPKPAYAEGGFIDTLKGWKNTIDTVTGIVANPGENMSQLISKFVYGMGETLTTALSPESFTTSANISDPRMRRGLVGVVEGGVISMFNAQPRVDVVSHLASEWVPGYKDSTGVYAGGYEDLDASGVTNLWSVVRNIAYLGYVVIMILIGFMVMFRNKIGGQLMVTVGNSLPKIVISLVLVTFSFAIMGLIIDFGGLLRNVIAGILYGSASAGIPVHNPFALLWGFFFKAGSTSPAMQIVGQGLNMSGVAGIILTEVGIANGILMVIFAPIILGIVLFGAIKLWIVLLKAYLSIVINTIISPLLIMFGALPGNDAMMWNTFKTTLRSVLVFPLAFAIVNLPYYLETKGLNLKFPETLVGADTASAGLTGGILGSFIMAVVKIIAIYAAASAPAIAMAIVPSTVSKGVSDAAGAIKAGLSGIPFVGGMFK